MTIKLLNQLSHWMHVGSNVLLAVIGIITVHPMAYSFVVNHFAIVGPIITAVYGLVQICAKLLAKWADDVDQEAITAQVNQTPAAPVATPTQS